MVRETFWSQDTCVLNSSSTLMTPDTLSIQPFRRSHSCEPLYDDCIDVVACTSFAPFARVISCPFVSKRDEYNRDIGRTTELELEEHFEPPIKQPRVRWRSWYLKCFKCTMMPLVISACSPPRKFDSSDVVSLSATTQRWLLCRCQACQCMGVSLMSELMSSARLDSAHVRGPFTLTHPSLQPRRIQSELRQASDCPFICFLGACRQDICINIYAHIHTHVENPHEVQFE
jgi:hypothetical protein